MRERLQFDYAWTLRQREVLRLIADGKTNTEIARELGLSLGGVKWHVSEILSKLNAESREEAAEYWRRQNGLAPRFARVFRGLAAASWLKWSAIGTATAAVVGTVVVVVAMSRDGAREPLPAATAAPDRATAMVDRVIDLARAGDLAAFKPLLKRFPEPCSNLAANAQSAPPCPAGAAEGDNVETFRAVSAQPVLTEAALEALLQNTVPDLTGIVAANRSQPDRVSRLFPPSVFEVAVYGGRPFRGAIYFVADAGVVGIYAASLDELYARLDTVPSGDWVVIRAGTARFSAEQAIYVVGRDSGIHFDVQTPDACDGLDLTLKLYVRPDPGVEGGVQSIKEPGLMSEAHALADTSGVTRMSLPLPATISGPIIVQPGLNARCFNEAVFTGFVQLAILAPPADAGIATVEVLGALVDLVAVSGQTFGGFFGGALTATAGGVACETVSLTDPGVRNGRGNVVFRIGTADQPPECRAPGEPITFLTAAGQRLVERPPFVAGAVQLVSNLGPEAPGH